MKLSFFTVSLVSLVVLGITSAYAEEYVITIPTGAANENSPYFWSEKSTGVTTGEIIIFSGDSVKKMIYLIVDFLLQANHTQDNLMTLVIITIIAVFILG
jgi:hypothetical protein